MNFPASDPLVTAVGGTALEADWHWNPQGTADDYWNCQLQNAKKCPTDFLASIEDTGTQLEGLWKEDWAGAGGGGGVSTVFDQPDFQKGLNSDVQKTANGHRTLPDIAMNAAINGGVEIYETPPTPSDPKAAPSPAGK